jgi:outer membrane protein assembly factor BamB
MSGCSDKKDTKKAAEKPAVLVPLTNHLVVKRVWATKISGEEPKLRLGLDVAVSGERVFVASHKGLVDAFDLKTGKRLWRHALKAPLSAGPSAGQELVMVGTSKGEIIALSQTDGSQRWRVRINAEILSAPAIAGNAVVVRAVDGKLHGLSPTDGTENWMTDQQVPRLSLRGTSTPLLAGDLAVTGFDNGRVIAVNRNNGTTVWDATVGQSHGSTELARLIDVDAAVVGDGEDLFAVAYQGRVAHLSRDTGEILWTHDMSSYRGLAIDSGSVYVSTADGSVVRLDRMNGTEQWTQKALARRQLTAPVIYGGYVVVADAGGVIHWLDPTSGEFVSRALVDKSGASKSVQSKGISLKLRISSEPIVAGDLLLVFSDSGLLSAFHAPPLASH